MKVPGTFIERCTGRIITCICRHQALSFCMSGSTLIPPMGIIDPNEPLSIMLGFGDERT